MSPSWEYIAGFFDGEGSIMVAWSNNSPQVRVSIANNDRSILEEIRLVTGGAISPNGKCNLLNICSGEEVGKFIREVQLRSFHRSKKRKLELGLILINLAPGRGKKLSDRDFLVRSKLVELFEGIPDVS